MLGKGQHLQENLMFFEDNGINTLKFDLPLELVFIKEKIIPGNICSLGLDTSEIFEHFI